MSGPPIATKPNGRSRNYFLLFAGVLGGVLAVLFCQSFLPREILFSNDGPLGTMVAECNRLPGRFFGTWRNLWWLGTEAPTAAPTISAILATVFPPVLFMKVYAPATIFFVGLSAWVFFRQLQFAPAVCVLGGIAAALNMHFLSTACWGLGVWNMSAGMIFLALAALCTKSIKQTWANAVLAGLAVGMNLMEGFDVGAIMSTYVGVFVLFHALSEEPGLARKAATGIFTEVVVILFAGLIAAHTIHSLVGTQIEGVSGTEQETETKERRWDFATQWSLPKVETLRLATPGLFGYRLEGNITTPDKSSAYWGLVGQDPRLAKIKSEDAQVRAEALKDLSVHAPLTPAEESGMAGSDRLARETAATSVMRHYGLISRYTGTGDYAGILTALLAVFAAANSCRGRNSPYSASERRSVWFWAVAALFSIMAAWGRHGFLYGLLYRLPYFSTIRNPVKFLHPFHIVWVILAAYGLEALYRRYLTKAVKRTAFLPDHIKQWWPRAAEFEKRWVAGCLLALAAALAALAVLLTHRERLVKYLMDGGFSLSAAPHMVTACAGEAAWFLLFLALSGGALAAILSGAWSGPRIQTAWIVLGVIMILDLGRSDLPWIHYFDYQEKYASNTVLDFLAAEKPYEFRVMGRLSPRRAGSSNGEGFGRLYNFWMQNDFPYHEIQSLDFAEMPRMPEMDDAYMSAFELKSSDIATVDLWPAARLWEMTGTRYLLMDASGVALLNRRADPVRHGFHLLSSFRMAPKTAGQAAEDSGDYTVFQDPKGPLGIIEYTNALPRAKLFARWETPANGAATLAALLSPSFIPSETVLLWTNSIVDRAPADAKADPGTVEITDYHPKDIKLRAAAKLPAVLLLNERYSPTWNVTVDQQPASLLRCNYIMRGVFLPPGDHAIEFRYHASMTTLWLSLSGWAAGALLAAWLLWRAISDKTAQG